MNVFGVINDNYWIQQADKLMRDLEAGVINRNDIAMGLKCTYSAGVIDSSLFNEEQKKDMYEALKAAYSLGNDVN